MGLTAPQKESLRPMGAFVLRNLGISEAEELTQLASSVQHSSIDKGNLFSLLDLAAKSSSSDTVQKWLTEYLHSRHATTFGTQPTATPYRSVSPRGSGRSTSRMSTASRRYHASDASVVSHRSVSPSVRSEAIRGVSMANSAHSVRSSTSVCSSTMSSSARSWQDQWCCVVAQSVRILSTQTSHIRLRTESLAKVLNLLRDGAPTLKKHAVNTDDMFVVSAAKLIPAMCFQLQRKEKVMVQCIMSLLELLIEILGTLLTEIMPSHSVLPHILEVMDAPEMVSIYSEVTDFVSNFVQYIHCESFIVDFINHVKKIDDPMISSSWVNKALSRRICSSFAISLVDHGIQRKMTHVKFAVGDICSRNEYVLPFYMPEHSSEIDVTKYVHGSLQDHTSSLYGLRLAAAVKAGVSPADVCVLSKDEDYEIDEVDQRPYTVNDHPCHELIIRHYQTTATDVPVTQPTSRASSRHPSPEPQHLALEKTGQFIPSRDLEKCNTVDVTASDLKNLDDELSDLDESPIKSSDERTSLGRISAMSFAANEVWQLLFRPYLVPEKQVDPRQMMLISNKKLGVLPSLQTLFELFYVIFPLEATRVFREDTLFTESMKRSILDKMMDNSFRHAHNFVSITILHESTSIANFFFVEHVDSLTLNKEAELRRRANSAPRKRASTKVSIVTPSKIKNDTFTPSTASVTTGRRRRGTTTMVLPK